MATDSILLVNDIPDHRSTYEAAFRARGYQVRLASSGSDALVMARHTHPACVIIDVRLPDMTGWELCRHFKADKRLSSVPVVMLAPDVSRETLHATRLSGCASWMMRPGSPHDLVHAVEHVLSHGGSHPELHNAMIGARQCPACERDDVRAGVRIGPVQYFMCKSCNMRWRVEAAGEATA